MNHFLKLLTVMVLAWGMALQGFGQSAAALEDKIFRSGDKFLNERKWDEAIAEYNRVIEMDPKDWAAYVNRGLAKKGKGTRGVRWLISPRQLGSNRIQLRLSLTVRVLK